MLPAYLGWLAVSLLLTGAALIFDGLRRRPRGEAIHCPGPAPRPLALLSPRRWLRRCGCWYNLTGLPELPGGALRCPECGTITEPRERLRDGRRWRPHVLGALLCATSLGVVTGQWIQTGALTRAVPAPILAAIEFAPYCWQPRELRVETHRRAVAGELDAVTMHAVASAIASDLVDDDIRWNADRAAEMLDSMWPSSRGMLESALSHRDRQARMIAASLLRQRCPDDPCDALLAASVEDLRDDVIEAAWWTTFNAREAAVYLVRFPERVEPLLRDALRSDDPQQRLLAAAIAGYAHLDRLAGPASEVLLPHLRNDDIFDNAKLAAPALYHFGVSVIPYLEPVTLDPDPQLRAIALAIIERVRFPDRPLRELRHPMPRITGLTDDPLRDLRLGEFIPLLPGPRSRP